MSAMAAAPDDHDLEIDVQTHSYVEITVGATRLRMPSSKARALAGALTDQADLIDGVIPLRDATRSGRHAHTA